MGTMETILPIAPRRESRSSDLEEKEEGRI
jgi:hypothetical protein